MARVSKQQMEKNREEIIRVSSQLFRERGLDSVSVNDLMNAAGLTHGGFYGHFASKDELVAVACGHAFAQSGEQWQQADKQDLRQLAEQYLTPRHRDNPAEGCPIAALLGDVAREPQVSPISVAYIEGVKQMLSRIDAASGQDSHPERPGDQALVHLALIAGALLLSRATKGDPLSGRFLEAAKQQLLADSSQP